MNLLAFDTSTEFLSIALQVGVQSWAFDVEAGATASQRILPEIHALLQSANIELTALDGVAFGAGPGAFTGVRVACGVAQGLAFGANLPVVGVHTLMAVAQASGQDKVIVCQDARMGEVYFAAYEKVTDVWTAISPAIVCKPELVPALTGSDWVGAGSGWGVYAPQLTAIYADQLRKILPAVTPNAQAILALAQPMFLAGLAQAAEDIAPIYIRNRVALTTQERAQGLRI
ncbi:tRNA (adenosine(37)-N6)-threonylcarbamoyltransferase complex dimerization subunit type 1 TsaB [Methylotenera sp. 1P/1]|uniref:tRNA (adenosine(37)-N6)-threonylcarbamoyltransferase complex dimerization subunit type 1 TsaB n=1 Tax=Methylotenera sp. 1P/1 TaxID=1131551 RepID=UPI000377BBAB|nr:tRNA (adenosine(37)-N6)-threonylcarbamoyltransferase complex dimerization subunit type 1 TsaB [Methylotenera sp. 1P/1]